MKIYFAGSIRGDRDDALLYADIIKTIQDMGYTVLTEHIGLKSPGAMGEARRTEAWIYKRDMNWLNEADCIIAEVTCASLGVGYEIAKAEDLGKPILCLYRPSKNKSLSAMLAGSPHVTNIDYATIKEAEKAIKKFTKLLVKEG